MAHCKKPSDVFHHILVKVVLSMNGVSYFVDCYSYLGDMSGRGYHIIYLRLQTPCSYILAASYNFTKYFNMAKSLQSHSHYKFCQGWMWIVLCSLEHKIRIFIAVTVNTVGSKDSGNFS